MKVKCLVCYIGTTVDKIYTALSVGECLEVDGVWVDITDDSGEQVTLVNTFGLNPYTEFVIVEP